MHDWRVLRYSRFRSIRLSRCKARHIPTNSNVKRVYMKKKAPKIDKVMKEYSKGDLHSGSKKGPVVKSKAQALAIAYSEAKKAKKK